MILVRKNEKNRSWGVLGLTQHNLLYGSAWRVHLDAFMLRGVDGWNRLT